MDATETNRRKRHLIVAAVSVVTVFIIGWFTLPILTEKILLGVTLLLIAGGVLIAAGGGYWMLQKKNETTEEM